MPQMTVLCPLLEIDLTNDQGFYHRVSFQKSLGRCFEQSELMQKHIWFIHLPLFHHNN